MQNLLLKKVDEIVQLENKLLKVLGYINTCWECLGIQDFEEKAEMNKIYNQLRAKFIRQIEQFEGLLSFLEEVGNINATLECIYYADRTIEGLKETEIEMNEMIRSL